MAGRGRTEPHGVTKHSELTVKAANRQSIVIDKIRKRSTDLSTVWKRQQIGTQNKSMKIHASKHNIEGLFSNENASNCHHLVWEYESQIKALINPEDESGLR